MWFIGVEVEQETSAPLPKKNPGSVPGLPVGLNQNSFASQSGVSSAELTRHCLRHMPSLFTSPHQKAR